MSEITTTFDRWPKELYEKRGLLNGERVQMARELRGMTRSALARKLGITTLVLAQLEMNWGFWQPVIQEKLVRILDFPVGFFTQDDPPVLGTVFMSGHDEEGNSWCSMEEFR